MFIEERRPIVGCWTGKEVRGHINLGKLANPETMVITLLGERIIPESFDCCGHPNFTNEQYTMYHLKKNELIRKNKKNMSLEAEIIYEEREFDVPRSSFDSVKGIQKSLYSLSSLNEMLDNRKRFLKVNKGEVLNEFMLFGCYFLSELGYVSSVERSYLEKRMPYSYVETYEKFKKNHTHFELINFGSFCIPKTDAVCSCCGKKITIYDVIENPCIYIEDKIYHDACCYKFEDEEELW